ncbi:MAG: DUF6263 family protein [Planctomycetota bacterium]
MNFIRGTLSALLLTIYIAPLAAQPDSDRGQLARWKLKEGQKLTATLTQETKIESRLNNRSKKTKNEMTLTMDWSVDSVKDNNTEITQVIRRIQLTLQSPKMAGTTITQIDTDFPDGNNEEPNSEFAEQLLKQVLPLIDVKFSTVINPLGELMDVSIPKASMEQLRQAPSSMQIRQILTEAGLRQMISQSTIVFPENRLQPNDQWSDRLIVSAEPPVNRIQTYTFQGREGQGGAMVFGITSKLENNNNNTNINSSKITEFTGTGEIKFDNNSETILDSQIDNSLTSRREYRDKTIRSKIDTQLKMTIKSKR